MAIHAGTGFIDILPRVSTAAFTGAMNAQLKPAMGGLTAGLKSSFAPLAPIIAGTAAVAVGKLTLDFENAFTRIAAISNASAEQITKWRSAVFELGRATAVAPAKLAKGLYFLASAGLDANQIFPALEASAKGAAIGLGEMEDITRTVAQVLNAYPEAGLKAINVVDALTAAVRESTAEPEEFAEALGRLLPIASKAEVGVEELVASLATLSNIGLDVDEGVTGVRQVLNLIVSPGKQATETMNELGIATEDLRKRLAEKGLINTLRFLDDAVGGNEDKFRKLLPNIRAMTAAFGLTVQEAEKVDGIFRRVANSAGDTGDALAETAAGPGFKFQRAMVALQSAAIRLGQVLLPVATTLADAFTAILGPITTLLEVMAKIPGLATAITFALVGFAAVKFLPGLLTLIGRAFVALSAARLGTLAFNMVAFGDALKAFGPAALRAVAPLALIPGAVFALAKVADERQTKAFEGLKDHIRSIGLEAAVTDGSLVQLRKSIARQHGVGFRLPTTTEQREAVRRDFEKLTGTLSRQARAQAIANTEIEEFQKQIKNAQPGLQAAARSLAAITDQNFNEFSAGLRQALALGQVDTKKWKDFVSETMGKAGEAIQEFHDGAVENLNFTAGALQELSSAATSAQEELATADLSVMDADDIAKLREAADLTAGELLKSFKDARKETQAFGQDLLVISNRGGEAGDRVAEVLLGMGDAGKAGADTIAQALRDTPKLGQALLDNFALGEGAAESLATKLTRRIVGTLESIREILDALATAWGIKVETKGADESKTKLDLILNRMREIDGNVATATVTTIFRQQGKPKPGYDPRQTDSEHGGFIPGAQHGMFAFKDQLLRVGEHSKKEAIVPLEDPRGIAALAKALREAGAGGSMGGDVYLDGDKVGRWMSKQQTRRRALVGA